MFKGVHTIWMLTSVLDYISFAYVDYIFLVMGYHIFTPLFLKWLNLNHLSSVYDCHSLSLPITVNRFSVLLGAFLQVWFILSYKSKADFFYVWGHLVLIFENECQAILENQSETESW